MCVIGYNAPGQLFTVQGIETGTQPAVAWSSFLSYHSSIAGTTGIVGSVRVGKARRIFPGIPGALVVSVSSPLSAFPASQIDEYIRCEYRRMNSLWAPPLQGSLFGARSMHGSLSFRTWSSRKAACSWSFTWPGEPAKTSEVEE